MFLLKGLRLVGGAVLLAASIWLTRSAPGFLSDRATTAPVRRPDDPGHARPRRRCWGAGNWLSDRVYIETN